MRGWQSNTANTRARMREATHRTTPHTESIDLLQTQETRDLCRGALLCRLSYTVDALRSCTLICCVQCRSWIGQARTPRPPPWPTCWQCSLSAYFTQDSMEAWMRTAPTHVDLLRPKLSIAPTEANELTLLCVACYAGVCVEDHYSVFVCCV